MAFEAIYRAEADIINYTPGSAVSAGQVVVINGRCFVAHAAIPASTLGSVYAGGVFDVTKQSGVTFTAGDIVYWDDTNNYANATSSNTLFGVATADAVSGDTYVRVLLLNLVNPLAVGSIPNIADGAAGFPIFIRKLVTAGGSGDTTVWTTTRKVRIVDAWLVARDTQAANVKLHSGTAGTDDITTTVAKGTTDNAIVRFTQMIAAKQEIASAGTLKANFSAAGTAEIYAWAIPVA